jgi:thioredoxin-related protein
MFTAHKLTAAVAMGLFIGLAGVQSAGAAESVSWYANIERASSIAQETNKPMVLDFQADWCAACKVMEKDVYVDGRVIDAARGFVPVRIDFDRNPAIAHKYNVTALPTLVFTDSYGDELVRWHGFIDARPLAEVMRSLPADVSEFNQLSRLLAKEKNNADALETMGNKLRAAGLFVTSNDYYGKTLQRPEAKADAVRREGIMNQMALNSLDVKDGAKAAETLEKCLKEFPNSRQRTGWTLNLGRAYAFADKKDKAKKILETFAREHPGAEAEQARLVLASL